MRPIRILEEINNSIDDSINKLRSEKIRLEDENHQLSVDFDQKYGSKEVTDDIRKEYNIMINKKDKNYSMIGNIIEQIKELKLDKESSENEKYYSDNTSNFVPEIQEMIKHDIDRDLSNYNEFLSEYESQMKYFKNISDNYYTLSEYTNYKRSLERNYYYNLMIKYRNISAIKHSITVDIISHYKLLQSKVENKVGKILKLEHLGGFDYKVVGENGNCKLEVIYAGGYNIQRLHTRWIIKK